MVSMHLVIHFIYAYVNILGSSTEHAADEKVSRAGTGRKEEAEGRDKSVQSACMCVRGREEEGGRKENEREKQGSIYNSRM